MSTRGATGISLVSEMRKRGRHPTATVPLRQSCKYTSLPLLHCYRYGGSPGAFRSVPLTLC